MHLLVGTQRHMLEEPRNDTTVILGTFDGMHLGHAALCEKARQIGGYRILHTFLQHPRAVVSGGDIPLLSTPDERACLAAKMGINEMRMMHFTSETANIAPEGFIQYIVHTLRPRHIIAGFNHTFGHKGKGDADLLAHWGKKCGYRTHIVPACKVDGEVVAARNIRGHIQAGNMEAAAKLLGRYYSVGGEVEHGRHLGQTIGFPTANIHPPNKLMPPFGVYLALVELKSGLYESVLNIGMRPTVNGHHMTIEAHLLDFAGDIYGKYARAHLLHFLRPEQKFTDKGELRAAIAQNVREARAYFEKRKS